MCRLTPLLWKNLWLYFFKRCSIWWCNWLFWWILPWNSLNWINLPFFLFTIAVLLFFFLTNSFIIKDIPTVLLIIIWSKGKSRLFLWILKRHFPCMLRAEWQVGMRLSKGLITILFPWDCYSIFVDFFRTFLIFNQMFKLAS